MAEPLVLRPDVIERHGQREPVGRLHEGLKGRAVVDLARERGTEPFDTLLDVVLADELRTVLWPIPTDDDHASWELRRDAWARDDVLLGGSDAGAHLDRMCGAPYTTQFLADSLRGRRLVSFERAVELITRAPAAMFGLRERGQVREGYRADLVVLDPATVGATDASLVNGSDVADLTRNGRRAREIAAASMTCNRLARTSAWDCWDPAPSRFALPILQQNPRAR